MANISRWLAVLIILIGAVSYGLLSSVVKLAYGAGWNDSQVTASQLTMGAIILWICVLAQPKSWSNPFRGPWIKLGLTGIFGLALCTVSYNKALEQLDASISVVLLFQFTWMTMLLEAIALKRWPKPGAWIAVLIIMAGTAMAVNVGEADWSRFTLSGVLLGLLSGFAYALFLFLTGKIQTTMHPFLKAAVMVTAALPVLYVMFPPNFSGSGSVLSLLLWGVALGMLGQAVPTIAFNIGIPRVGSALAANLGAIELPAVVVSAFFILNETVQGLQWFGMLSILAGIVIAERWK